MAEYANVKLKSGKDLVGIISADEGEFVIIDAPLEIMVHPVHGMFAKSWLLLSEENSVILSKSDIFYVQKANDKAVEYYEEFKARLHKFDSMSENMLDDDYKDELENMFESMLESKMSTKH